MLESFFVPRTVAVVGATEKAGSAGRTALWNLIASPFGGTVYPVTARRTSVLGIRSYPSLRDLPEPIDLAVVVTPAPGVPDVIAEAVQIGVRSAIVLSAGFSETGPDGAMLEQRMLEEARRGGMRVIGPNCLGVMSPVSGLNATLAATMARSGSVGFVSQSGALCTAVLDWSHREAVGFSAVVSTGSMADVDWGDVIAYLGNDSRTKSIVIYMETIGDPRSFMSAAREVALSKPIIVLKAGRSQAAATAAASHTGLLAGSDEVLDAAFRRCGVLRVHSIAELFYMAEVLAKQPRPKGPRLTIVTNAGGPGVLACDALLRNGGELAPLAETTAEALSALLPPHWSHANPVDLLGDADPDTFSRAVVMVATDPNTDGVLVILAPQLATDATQTAEALKQRATEIKKPLLASWMGGADVAAGEAILSRAGIPTFPYPDTAARVFTYMWRYSESLRGLYETPVLPEDIEGVPDRATADRIITGARSADRTLLTEEESERVIAAYGIPTVPVRLARTADEAVAAADATGYPVAVKVHSASLAHKTDAGGVRLNLHDAGAVRDAVAGITAGVSEKAGPDHVEGFIVQPMVNVDGCELILGSSLDVDFGPVVLFGTGGRLVEVFRDSALGLPPLTTTLARRMIERTQIGRAIVAGRLRAEVDLAALEELVVRFSQLVVEQRAIKEVDINPLAVAGGRLVALDARIVLHDRDISADRIPRLAIRPYPRKYMWTSAVRTDETITIRPIRPEDEPLMVPFHEGLSERSVYLRYFHMMKLTHRIAHERLTRICFIDYDREMALVAERRTAGASPPDIIGVARLHRLHGTSDAEFSVIVEDKYQGHGLGEDLMRRLVDVARAEGIGRLVADVLKENVDMQRMCARLGITFSPTGDPQIVKGELVVTPA